MDIITLLNMYQKKQHRDESIIEVEITKGDWLL